MEIFLNGKLMAQKSEGTHKILNKWPSGGVFVLGQEQVHSQRKDYIEEKLQTFCNGRINFWNSFLVHSEVEWDFWFDNFL